MKQNRLVQRKFAQGVPIPASSSSVAPLPPERKAETAYPPNLYHNNMSARSLLDIVSMQNTHKHQQEPLVVLERLRDDEIPSPPAPRVRMRLLKKGVKGSKDMCLRSGKRKPDAAKGCPRKRKKLSSESTDDVPLKYYFNRPNQAKPHSGHKPKVTDKKAPSFEIAKRTLAAKRRERSRTLVSEKTIPEKHDRSFTFKEPTSPARVSNRLYKINSDAKAAGRVLRKSSISLNARWSSLRSARTPSDRAAALLGKKPPKPSAVRKGSRTVSKDEQPPTLPGASGTRAATNNNEQPPSPLGASGSRAATNNNEQRPSPLGASGSRAATNNNEQPPSPLGASGSRAATNNNEQPPSPLGASGSRAATNNIEQRPSLPGASGSRAATNNNEQPPSPLGASGSRAATNNNEQLPSPLGASGSRAATNTTPTSEASDPFAAFFASLNNFASASTLLLGDASSPNISVGCDTGYTGQPDWCIQEVVKAEAEKMSGIANSKDIEITSTAGAVDVEGHEETRRKATKPSLRDTKTKLKRGAKTAAPRLLRNSRETSAPQQQHDVYEFDAELEASRPLASLRRRGQATPDIPPASSTPRPPSSESVEYVDIPTSSHCIKITPTKQQESGAECLSVSLVPKEEISINKKKNLIENLSNSPALLNKFFNCLTPELQNELDNLITAEGLNGQASSSALKGESSTYLDPKEGSVFEALTFHPTAEEFQDPIKYFDKIAPQASKYGLCKIVPPEGFKPPCNLSDTTRFAVIYQYISKMYSRWGPVSRELAAIKAHLRTQSVMFARSPLLDGSEINLPKLYHAVERNGGLSNVILRKRWARVAEELKLAKLQRPERKLDPIYMRYLLPYATLSDQERQNIMAEVERCWTTKYQHMLERARNPFQRQNRMLGTESESDDDSEDGNTAGALHEAEDCIVQGRTMNLATFKKIATSLMDAHFEPSKQPPSAVEVEKAYWRAVLLGTEHIVANTASIDTGEEGYGFPKDPEAEYGTHPWNLKVLARNPNNVLRYLGPVLGVTVPTLHMSMLFSTSCWHRDPHGLPWTEYMHSGAEKVWYGIPRDESANFRRAVETLCPAYCQNKSIWLASEITMVPPNILSEHGVKLSRLQQRPGEYVMVFPEAHSCSITTGAGISESVYFASNGWLSDVYKLFQELRNSCEPTMFSLEQLLLAGSADPAAPQQVCSVLCTLLGAELEHRRALEQKGLKVQERPASSAPLNTSYFRVWNTRDQDECEYCRSTLFLSKVTGLTGRKSAVCPEHALRLLETKRHKNVDLSSLEFLSSYSTCVLEEMLERLERVSSEESEASFVDRAPSVIDLTGAPS